MSKSSVLYIVIFLFFVYAVLNVYASQSFNPLFFHLVERQHKSDAVAFLKKIQNTAYFSDQSRLYRDQLLVFTRMYGQSIIHDLSAEKESRINAIAKFERLLEKNPRGRDVLIQLAILYDENDQPSRAKNYYQQAKTIDPEIKIPQLDKL